MAPPRLLFAHTDDENGLDGSETRVHERTRLHQCQTLVIHAPFLALQRSDQETQFLSLTKDTLVLILQETSAWKTDDPSFDWMARRTLCE